VPPVALKVLLAGSVSVSTTLVAAWVAKVRVGERVGERVAHVHAFPAIGYHHPQVRHSVECVRIAGAVVGRGRVRPVGHIITNFGVEDDVRVAGARRIDPRALKGPCCRWRRQRSTRQSLMCKCPSLIDPARAARIGIKARARRQKPHRLTPWRLGSPRSLRIYVAQRTARCGLGH
jgi:hypothetical protein